MLTHPVTATPTRQWFFVWMAVAAALVSFPVQQAIATTAAWRQFAEWVTR